MQTRALQRGEVFRELAPDLDAVGEIGVVFETRKNERTKTRKRQGLNLHLFQLREFANSIDLECTPTSERLAQIVRVIYTYPDACCRNSAWRVTLWGL
jgi:hypothetical protein